MSRIFLTGDLHATVDIHKLNMDSFPMQKILTKDDYLIVLGDFGLIWNNSESKEEKYWLDWLNGKNFTTLFLDGNHENHLALNANYPEVEFLNGKCHQIRDSIFHMMRGEIFTINNKKFFAMGGAESSDKAYRTENISWWLQEIPSATELSYGLENLEKNNSKVDYILSHCGPDLIQDIVGRGYYKHNLLTNYFQIISECVEFKKWYMGHYHTEGTIYERYELLYNSIIEITEE